MKKSNKQNAVKLLFMALVLILATVLFGACNQEQPSAGTEKAEESSGLTASNESEPDTRSSADISEQAMENFLANVAAGKYVMDFPEHVKTTVFSEDLVYYEFAEQYGIGFGEDVAYFEVAFMTVNGEETFIGYFGENDAQLITFAEEGKAREIASRGSEVSAINTRLPDYWTKFEVSGGNIWNLFTNYDADKPLSFVGTDYQNVIRDSMQIIAGLGESVINRMQDVYLEFEDEDARVAHFKTSFSAGLTPVPDIDIVITFGDAASEPRAEAWMNDENREYPAAKTDWDDVDEMNLNAVFLPEYGRTAVPFPEFASYALTVDISRILSDDEIGIRDMKATEEDLETYRNELLEAGFTAAEEDGQECYRLLLREEYNCYSSIQLDYDRGVNITAKKHYEFPEYEGLETVNEILTAAGYDALPENETFSEIRGEDRKNEMTESWLYFFGYDLGLYVNVNYADYEEAERYLSAYSEVLKAAGFETAFTEDENSEYDDLEPNLSEEDAKLTIIRKLKLEALPFGEENYLRKETAGGVRTFRFHFDEDGETLRMLFKSEAFVAPETAETKIREAGFPEIRIPAERASSCRDFRKFQKTMYGQDASLDLSLSLTFEKEEDESESEAGRAYLDELFDGILLPAGFGPAAPSDEIRMNKSTVFFKEAEAGGKVTRHIVGLEYTEDLTFVMLEFRVED